MLVLHHCSFHTRERPANHYYLVAGDERRHLRLVNDNILVARLHDDFETLHLSVGDGEKIIHAVGIDVEVIIIRCHARKNRFVFQQRAEVVESAAQEQQAAVERLVRDVLRGVVKIFVGIFDMPDDGQIKFEVFVVDGDECIVKFLRSVVRGAYWEPVLYVWQKGNPNRLPVIGILSAGICLNDAFIALDEPLCSWFNFAISVDKFDYRQKNFVMDNSIRFLPLQRYKEF